MVWRGNHLSEQESKQGRIIAAKQCLGAPPILAPANETRFASFNSPKFGVSYNEVAAVNIKWGGGHVTGKGPVPKGCGKIC